MIENVFIDSGAFSLGPLVEKGKLNGRKRVKKWKQSEWSWYDTGEFRDYIDRYATFVKEHTDYIDIFVNVDVLDDPDRTYRNQRYIEDKFGIRPVPVLHSFTSIEWIEQYLDEGHTYIALGGMGGKRMHMKESYQDWMDSVYTFLCPESNGFKPLVKTHGFAVTSWESLQRYPWYSVDSTTYVKMAGYGWLLVPFWHPGEDRPAYERPYQLIGVCTEPTKSVKEKRESKTKHTAIEDYEDPFVSPALEKSKSSRSLKHIGKPQNRNKRPFDMVVKWLDHIGVSLGTEDGSESGVVNNSKDRIRANLMYFDRFTKTLPEWPWAYHVRDRSKRGPIA